MSPRLVSILESDMSMAAFFLIVLAIVIASISGGRVL